MNSGVMDLRSAPPTRLVGCTAGARRCGPAVIPTDNNRARAFRVVLPAFSIQAVILNSIWQILISFMELSAYLTQLGGEQSGGVKAPEVAPTSSSAFPAFVSVYPPDRGPAF